MNIFIFHNDLRLHDNNGLAEALSEAKTVPIFIFTPDQIGNQNRYRSQNCINFMCESLKDLDSELRKHGSRLHTYYGHSHAIVARLLRTGRFSAVYSNFGYTPFAILRDKKIAKVCKSADVEFRQFHDFGLLPIGEVTTSGGVYKKFTPYYEAARHRKIPKPARYSLANLAKISGTITPISKYYKYPNRAVEKYLKAGGRKNGLAIISGLGRLRNYDKTRNILSIDTSQLSAYLKFGCVSAREVYHASPNSDFTKQLFWREFFMNLSYEFPHTIAGSHGHRNFNPKYDSVKWARTADAKFKKWCEGQTGYPIVDAAMRQLNQIGWMHNRGRLIVSAFLVKLLGYHWELGERYFATQLRDYDPVQNNGGWQFVAGSGVDSQPYFRMFNPWLQSEKYDPDAKYIKKWCPELENIPAADIHKWYDRHQNCGYPKPMVDYEEYRDRTRKLYTK